MRSARLLFAGLVIGSACGSVQSEVDAGAGSGTDARLPDAGAPTFTVTVAPAGNGTGTVTSTPAGISCGTTCSGAFAMGTSVTLHAASDGGSTFLGWSGAGCTGTGDCTFSVTADVTVAPTFGLENSVVVTLAGTGTGHVGSSPTGIDCPSDCSEAYGPGQTVVLTASATGDSYFAGWTGGGCSGTGTCSVVTSSAVGVTATFTLNQYALTVMKSGNGSGTVTSAPAGINCGTTCSGQFDSGAVVTLTAAAATGSTFSGWSGGGCSGTGTCAVTIGAATTVTATFALGQYTVSVVKGGTGAGTVTSNVGGISCGAACTATLNYGSQIILTATPAVGSDFTAWSGGGCSGTGTCTVTVSAATTVTATFTLQQRTLTFVYRSFGAGTGTATSSPAGVNCAGNCTQTVDFPYGTVVTLTKAPTGSPASLAYWAGDCSGTGACSVTMTANHAVTATFSHTNYVFVTVDAHNGDWSGNLANADAFCNAEATSAGLPGTYVAWISSSTITAGSRLGSARGWMRVDGLPFADTVATLTTNRKIFYPVRLDAKGDTLAAIATVATGTNGDGTADTGLDCNNWSSSSAAQSISGGIAAGASGEWSEDSSTTCANTLPYYCMGTDFTTAVTPAAAQGRHAFVSPSWTPGSGIANADAQCQSQASAAGLANAANFKAFLATTSASAISRFNVGGTPWVRTDGIQIVAAPSDMATDALLAPIAVQANGTTYNAPAGRVWGGATSGTVAGSVATTCSDWSGTSGTATVGIDGWANHGEFAWNTSWSCSSGVGLLCLEN